jgi:hypothetical protein
MLHDHSSIEKVGVLLLYGPILMFTGKLGACTHTEGHRFMLHLCPSLEKASVCLIFTG